MTCLSTRLLLLGIGHLGQAYAWALGMLPYARPEEAEFGLMDFDRIVEGNAATGCSLSPATQDAAKPA